MAPVVLYAVTLAVAARRLQDASCPCLQSPPSGSDYPYFALAGTTIGYEYGALRVSPKSETQIVPVLVIVPCPSYSNTPPLAPVPSDAPMLASAAHRLRSLHVLSPRLGQAAVLLSGPAVMVR